MEKRFISWPKIASFESTLKGIELNYRFVGRDEKDKAVYDLEKKITYDTINITATEKIHGTNAAFCYNNEENWTQSRSRIIEPGDDNKGCALWVSERKDLFISLAKSAAAAADINLDEQTICICFEIAGGSVGKRSCIAGQEKMAFVFENFLVAKGDEKTIKAHDCETLDLADTMLSNRIMSCPDIFPLQLRDEELKSGKWKELFAEKVLAVENYSPTAAILNIDGTVGEGFVGSFLYQGEIVMFKEKGTKHVKGGKKQPSVFDSLSDEENERIKKFVDEKALTASRLDQAMGEISNAPTMREIGPFLKWLLKDILVEEVDAIAELKDVLEWNKLSKAVAAEAKKWFESELN